MNFSLIIIMLILGVVLPLLIWLLFSSQKRVIPQSFLEIPKSESSSRVDNEKKSKDHRAISPLYFNYFEEDLTEHNPVSEKKLNGE
jgi:hypothetical protein